MAMNAVAGPGGAILIDPAPDPAPVGADAPAVHTPASSRLAEAEAVGMAFDCLVETRWCDPVDPQLNPYRGARLLAAGWSEFRTDWANDLREMARLDPNICGRINPDLTARAGWMLIVKRLKDFGRRAAGRVLKPAEVIEIYEKTYRPPEKRPALRDSVFEIERRNPSPGGVDGFRGSATAREGTLSEICSDIMDRDTRENTLNMIDRCWPEGFGAKG